MLLGGRALVATSCIGTAVVVSRWVVAVWARGLIGMVRAVRRRQVRRRRCLAGGGTLATSVRWLFGVATISRWRARVLGTRWVLVPAPLHGLGGRGSHLGVWTVPCAALPVCCTASMLPAPVWPDRWKRHAPKTEGQGTLGRQQSNR